MLIVFEDRASDSPIVDRIWRSHSERAGVFHSMATSNWVMVVTRLRGQVWMTVRGPETRATLADCPADGEWFGIHFKVGSFMSSMPPASIRDRNDVTLPQGAGRSFRLDGSAWEYPTFENAETFVRRLVKRGLVVTDRTVVSALAERPDAASRRTEQRHFQRATGMTRATLRQIERARRATSLLQSGRPIADVVFDLGYYDQAHLTRSLRHFVGQTPLEIARQREQLSLLYKPE